MKFNPAVVSYFLQRESTKRNIRQLLKFLFALAVLVSVYSVLFHFLMSREGQNHSWITWFYWTLTVMSTLGFGDITGRTERHDTNVSANALRRLGGLYARDTLELGADAFADGLNDLRTRGRGRGRLAKLDGAFVGSGFAGRRGAGGKG